MNKINFKGITSESVIGVLALLLALINATLQMFGYNILPINNDDIANIVSTIFLMGTAVWNTWKNRNFSKPSQIGQQITDIIKHGEALAEDIEDIIDKFKDNKQMENK